MASYLVHYTYIGCGVMKVNAENKKVEKIDYKKVKLHRVKSKQTGVFKKKKIKPNAWF